MVLNLQIMEDFDVFTNEINFTRPLFKNILNKYVNDVPSTPNAPNYQSGRKLMAEECLSSNDELGCAFHLSEAASAFLRTMLVYREEQLKFNENKLYKITSYIKPIQDLVDTNTKSKKETELFKKLSKSVSGITDTLASYAIEESLPFHRRYLHFTKENNLENFQKILKDLPKEWTVIQLTVPYNPNENIMPLKEYRKEVDSIYLSMFTNEYLDNVGAGPVTVYIPSNVTKEGELPLFTELYSLLDENYKTIDNAQFLNKRLVQKYWSKREDIDLRMKSVINVMDKEWLGGWNCLLTGKLVDTTLRDRIMKLVDTTISDWGFIRLNKKQKILLYNLIDCCPVLQTQQIKSCIRKILTECGDTEDVRQVFSSECGNCTKEFKFLNELCLKCLSKSFENIHHFTLVDGIRAFSQAVNIIKDNDEWAGLRKAKRHPVILIVDDMLDTFPWETLPVLNHHPVSRLENLHFLYYLYKIHEKDIKDGYFRTTCEVGRYVINPEQNLDRMEKRMASFVQYWCSTWSGHIGKPPPPTDFVKYISEADVFLYCGHGDGCQLAAGGGSGVESVKGRALVVLAGCCSVRRSKLAPRAPPQAAHMHLHVAGCPTVVGMLWEVTDLEVDKMVSTLVSLCVPSAVDVPWPSVGKAKWSQGVLETSVEQKSEFVPERNVLRAVSRARGSTNYVMIASSMVVRGLPFKVIA